MFDLLDRVITAPTEFNAVALAGRKRVLAEHTWDHRVAQIVEAVQRFKSATGWLALTPLRPL